MVFDEGESDMTAAQQTEFFKQEFPKRLKEALKNKDMSQKQLAVSIKITECTLSNYLRAKRIPSVTKVVSMADVLEVDLRWLACECE